MSIQLTLNRKIRQEVGGGAKIGHHLENEKKKQ